MFAFVINNNNNNKISAKLFYFWASQVSSMVGHTVDNNDSNNYNPNW